MSAVHDFEAEAERRMRAVEALDTSDLSHDTLANRFSAERLRGNGLYVAAWHRWMLWAGARWEADNRLRHMTMVRAFLRDMAQAASDKDAENLRSDMMRAAVERMARSNEEVAASADQWDADPWLLGTPSGTVDLRTGQLCEARRDDYITKLTAVTPADTADCPQWQAFLRRIFQSQPDIVPFLQRAAGYALTGQTTEHKLLFAFGTGRNGKGVFFNTLGGIIGDYATVAASSTFLDSGMDSHPTDLASLAGARMVTASELPPGKAWNEARIKSLTGGDPITARRMRQDFFTFEPQFTLMIAGNHMPSFRGIDEATRARVLLIPFAETIPPDERDPSLADRLRAEWPAILRWAIDGALEWQDIGLSPPPAVDAASEEYMDDEDELGQFVGECLHPDAEAFVLNRDLYQTFRQWSEDRGMRSPWTQRALTQALIERGYSIKRRKQGRGLAGYRLMAYESSSYAKATRGW